MKLKETAKSPDLAWKKRLPSVAIAALGAALLYLLLWPEAESNPDANLVRVLRLGWKIGSPPPCPELARGKFFGFSTATAWGEFYVAENGKAYFPPEITPFPPDAAAEDEGLSFENLNCVAVPAPSGIQEF